MGVTVRAATDDDYEIFVQLFPELEVPDPLLTRAAWCARPRPRTLVATDGERGVGYVFTQNYGVTAHVVHLVTDPGARRCGVGRALLEAARERAVREGCTHWYLNVKVENEPAKRLYGRAGMRFEREARTVSAAWSRLKELPEADVEIVATTEADDVELAAFAGVDPARIRYFREHPDVVIEACRSAGKLVGFGTLNPAYPSVYPIAVTEVGLAGPLFRSLSRFARGETVVVVVEGDRALYDTLVSAGAETLHAIHRMGSAL